MPNHLNLLSEYLNSAHLELKWDGTNNDGKKADAGLYFISVVSGNTCETMQVILLN